MSAPRGSCYWRSNPAGSGAVTVGLGENRDLGGANATGFGYASALQGATVEVDGKKLVAEGKVIV